MAVSGVQTVVGQKGRRRRSEAVEAQGCVHDLIANENARIRAHRGSDPFEDPNAVFIRPVVPVRNQDRRQLRQYKPPDPTMSGKGEPGAMK
jgi:hypothetical protein